MQQCVHAKAWLRGRFGQPRVRRGVAKLCRCEGLCRNIAVLRRSEGLRRGVATIHKV